MVQLQTKEVKNILNATFPDYRKRKVYVKPCEKVRLSGLNWSGGSRSEYRACTIDGKSIPNNYNMSAPAPWNNPFEGAEVNIPENIVIVESGYFCGKTSTAYIYVNPANMPKFITE